MKQKIEVSLEIEVEDYLARRPMINAENETASYIQNGTEKVHMLLQQCIQDKIEITYYPELATIDRCRRIVCVARTAQEPSTTCSGAFGSCKFELMVRTHLEINDGHRFSIFERDLPASLKVRRTKKASVTLLICISRTVSQIRKIQRTYASDHFQQLQ